MRLESAFDLTRNFVKLYKATAKAISTKMHWLSYGLLVVRMVDDMCSENLIRILLKLNRYSSS